MKYLKSKPGSIEEIVANQTSKFREDSGYQAMFKKELEKAGKGIGAMSPAEKKAFFNKIDSKYSAKSEAKVDELTSAQKKLPPALQKAIKAKEKNEDLDNKDKPTVKDVIGQLKGAVKAHSKQAKDLEKAMKTEVAENKFKQNTTNALPDLMLTYGKPNGMATPYYTDKMQDLQNKAADFKRKGYAIGHMGKTGTLIMKKGIDRIPGKGMDIKAGYKMNEDLEEGKMSQINQMQKDGKSAEEIAKLMKLPVDTVKSILGETKTYTEKTLPEIISKMWEKSASEIEEVKSKAKYLKAKSDVSKTMVDTEKTKIDTKPEVSYDK